jgi:hypothetical protein
MRYPGENAGGRAPGRRQSPSARVSPPGERPGAGQKAPRGDAALFTPGYSDGRAADQDPVPASGRYGMGGAAGKGPIRGFPPVPGQPPPLYPPGPFSAWNRAPGPDGNGYDPGASDAWLVADYAGPAEDGYPGPDDAAAGYADPGRRGLPEPGLDDPGHPGFPPAGLDDAGYSEPGTARADAGPTETGYADPDYPVPSYSDPGYSGPGYSALAVSDPAADATPTQAWQAVDHPPAASHWSDLAATDEGWPDPDAHQDGMPPAAALAGGLAGPVLAGPGRAGPGRAGPGLSGPGQHGPGKSDPDGWDDPRWAGPGEAPPFERVDDTAPGAAGTGPGQRATAGAGAGAGLAGPPAGPPDGPPDGRAASGRGRGTRGRGRARGRRRPVRTLLVCVLALAVVVGATYLWFSRTHKPSDDAAISQQTAAAKQPSPTDPAPSPSPSLGAWGHIESRTLDPVPLTLAELFPAQFSGGGTSYVKTVQKAKTHCVTALMGSQLIAAVGQAGCTQAMRASYLSADHKVMGTIGVLNLATAAAAEKAGRAAGPAEFIAQLPTTTGPTKNLTKGTGFEAAEVKGHYLVLGWVEFADLRPPRSAAQRTELESFISLLFQETANVSLATREVTGSPPPP